MLSTKNTSSNNLSIHSLLSSAPVELPPIKDLHKQNFECKNEKLPTFLEPIPFFKRDNFAQTFSPRMHDPITLPSLVPSSSSSAYSSDSSNPPSPTANNDIPQRLPTIRPKPTNFQNNNTPLYSYQVMPKTTPSSPTMMAASASAATAASQHPSEVANTFLNSLSLSLSDNEEPLPSAKSIQVDHTRPSFAKVSFMVHGGKRSCPYSTDQKMYLTKNAHIKRPRNAWIHFRCHYGQALKTQDPTLRAEEISKRASRRWASLSEVEKKPWQDLAEQDKQAHKAAFPGYRYCPRRSNTPAMLAAKQSAQQDF